MNIKSIAKLGFLISLFIMSSKVFCVGVVELTGDFLSAPYKVTLYNIRSLFESEVVAFDGVKKEIEKPTFMFLLFDQNDEMFKAVHLGLADKFLSRFLAVNDHGVSRVKFYDKERIAKDSFDRLKFLEKRSNFYKVCIVHHQERHKNRHGKSYEQDFGNVPVALFSGEGKGGRNSLFDLFSQQVDAYLFTYGLGEMITHKNNVNNCEYDEEQFQISLFGSLELEEFGYFALGFFQYTFNSKGICYHRAFKPWRTSCLKRLSNGFTQCWVRKELCSFLTDLTGRAPTNDVELVLAAKLKEHGGIDPFIDELINAMV